MIQIIMMKEKSFGKKYQNFVNFFQKECAYIYEGREADDLIEL